MVDVIVVVAGAVLVAVIFIDAFVTTLAVSAGPGRLTSLVLGVSWRLLLRAHRQDKESSLLTAAGPFVLIVTVLVWVAGLWAGWSMVFLGSDAVVDATSKQPASVGDVIYYAGFTVFTLGTGDFVATGTAWRVTTAVATFCGLFLVTLAITYLISVVSAVVARRALTVQIRGLGSSVGEIVTQGWTGDEFGSMFQQQLVALGADVATSAEQHLAYPVLHYFHSSSRDMAAPIAVAQLDDALTVLREGVSPDHRPEPSAVVPLQSALGRYLDTAGGTGRLPEAGPPAPVDVTRVAQAGIPLTDDAITGRIFGDHQDRRAKLHRIVLSDGWSWAGRGSADDE